MADSAREVRSCSGAAMLVITADYNTVLAPTKGAVGATGAGSRSRNLPL